MTGNVGNSVPLRHVNNIRKDSLDDESSPITVVAVLYALAYLNEHREEADHHALTITLRNLLFGERDARF